MISWKIELQGDDLEVEDNLKENSKTMDDDNDPELNNVISDAKECKTDSEPVPKKRKRRNTLASSLRSSFSLCNSSKKKKTKHSNQDKGNWSHNEG